MTWSQIVRLLLVVQMVAARDKHRAGVGAQHGLIHDWILLIGVDGAFSFGASVFFRRAARQQARRQRDGNGFDRFHLHPYCPDPASVAVNRL